MKKGENNMKDITIIDNILRTLIEIFADVVVSIEESKEIDAITVDEL